MSLNGLEAPEVYQAYQAALGEGGGWFVNLSSCQDTKLKLKLFLVGSYSST